MGNWHRGFGWVACALAVFVFFGLAGCNAPEMSATPFYTGDYSRPQGPPEERVNLWPVAYYHDPALSVLWPLMDWTDDHWAVRPFYSVYKLDEEKQDYNVLWPLTSFDFDDQNYHILPCFWGGAGEDDQYFVAFPVFWYTDSGRTHSLFPLYVYDHGTSKNLFLLAPFIHYRWGPQKNGWGVWPLAGNYTEGKDRYNYALWPICQYWGQGDSYSNLSVFPVYFRRRHADSGWDLALPLFWHSYNEKKDDSLFLSWLYSRKRSPESDWSLTFPLYWHSRDDERSAFVTPLFGKMTSPERSTWVLSPLVSWFSTAPEGGEVWFLAPLTHWRWGDAGSRHHVFPLYYRDGINGAFYSLPASWGNLGEGRFMNILGPLFNHWSDDEGNWRTYAPFPFVSFHKKKDGGGSWVWPLYGHERNARGSKGFYAWPLFNYVDYDNVGKLEVFPLFSHGRLKHATEDRKAGIRHVRETRRLEAAVFYSHAITEETHERTAADESRQVTTHRDSFPVLWNYEKRVEGDGDYVRAKFSILGWLYDTVRRMGTPVPPLVSAKDGAAAPEEQEARDYVRRRILWRIMHYERDKGDRSLDVFPFITWDKKETGYRKFSFGWRLFRNERGEDGSRNVDVLFIPMWRSN